MSSIIKLLTNEIICKNNSIHLNRDPEEHLYNILRAIPPGRRRARRITEALYNNPGQVSHELSMAAYTSAHDVNEAAGKSNKFLVKIGYYLGNIKLPIIPGIESMRMQRWFLFKLSPAQHQMLLDTKVI